MEENFNEEFFLTLNDLVKRTQLPKSWWYTQTRQREGNGLPVVPCGKYLRFRWHEVLEWLEGQK